MTLTVGSRLGPYEIVLAIGAGEMGEVYRARDTRLRREVALKVPTDVAPGLWDSRSWEDLALSLAGGGDGTAIATESRGS